MSSAIHLTKAARLQVEAIREVLAPWGLASQLVNEGPHMCLKVTGPRGGVWRLMIAGTPRDADAAVVMARGKARRLVRQINGRAGY
jgi:hypothetical protein